MQSSTRDIVGAILLGGLIAGAVDIGAAALISGRGFGRIMQVIAGGLLGKATFDGGANTMLLGFFLQESMGVLIAAVYLGATRALFPGLLRRWLIAGLAYGVIVFFVMNYAVLPLSAWKSVPHFTVEKFAENMAAMLVFGLIIAFFARRIPAPLVISRH